MRFDFGICLMFQAKLEDGVFKKNVNFFKGKDSDERDPGLFLFWNCPSTRDAASAVILTVCMFSPTVRAPTVSMEPWRK